jgi:hypothetical protein
MAETGGGSGKGQKTNDLGSFGTEIPTEAKMATPLTAKLHKLLIINVWNSRRQNPTGVERGTC